MALPGISSKKVFYSKAAVGMASKIRVGQKTIDSVFDPFLPRPYHFMIVVVFIDEYDAMNMIRHNDVTIQRDMMKMIRNFFPDKLRLFPIFIQHQIPVNHLAKQARTVFGDYGLKRRTGGRIVIPFQAGGTAIMFPVIFHNTILPQGRVRHSR